MTRDIPIIPTVVVVIAAAIMVALGIWQLGRIEEKAEMIARYEAALVSGEPQVFPAEDGGLGSDDHLYHPTQFQCSEVLSREAIAGRNAKDQTGFVHVARCATPRGPADVKLGWSRSPDSPAYVGGAVSGLIVRGGVDGARVQMTDPIEGLEPIAAPDPKDLPNNHLAYAGQWFFFAATALLIYFFALKARGRARAGKQD